MVLSHEDFLPVLQPNLNWIQEEQGNIIYELDTLAWRSRRSQAEYVWISMFLEEEEGQANYPVLVL